ncbi:hypothetical protein DSO57_1038806 [Entomophthora muscae]|uniref:Uncharacterized protein n=2 Tax=Entomophthora muscae TaxID=34485 RepID=A0ACC2RIX2_9FUNG|nr:hypothetical protein DSO57_1019675 [Entomophthora muscae]KAJ9083032.1 hypothetical protein DSO57_1038806 [Entomophthora muscae]
MDSYRRPTEKTVIFTRRLRSVTLEPGEDRSINVGVNTLLWIYNSLGLNPSTSFSLLSVKHTLIVEFHFGWRDLSGITHPIRSEFPITLQSLPRSLISRPGPPTYIQPPAYTP